MGMSVPEKCCPHGAQESLSYDLLAHQGWQLVLMALITVRSLNSKRNMLIAVARAIRLPRCVSISRALLIFAHHLLDYWSNWAVEAGRMQSSWRCSSLSSQFVSVITGRFDYQGFIDTYTVALCELSCCLSRAPEDEEGFIYTHKNAEGFPGDL